jgi:hypothetical protein
MHRREIVPLHLCSHVSYSKLLTDYDELQYWECMFEVVMLVYTVPTYSETPT